MSRTHKSSIEDEGRKTLDALNRHIEKVSKDPIHRDALAKALKPGDHVSARGKSRETADVVVSDPFLTPAATPQKKTLTG